MPTNRGDLNSCTQPFPSDIDEAALARFVACFPYPMQVFIPDGTLVMVNDAFLREFHIPEAARVVGRYNVLQDPTIKEYGVDGYIRRAFAGEVVFARDVRVPVRVLKEHLDIPVISREMQFEDISSFPIFGTDGRLLYVVNILLAKRRYYERGEIMEAISHIEANWKEAFCAEDVARVVNLSPSYFCRLFKTHTGSTPHEYYIQYKIEKLKEALFDANLTVEQAFTTCGVTYHGYYARLFRERTGYSPSEYRRLAQK